MEVLISMFVLLFGLMGVAAIFPVGNHYVIEGEKHDQGNALALNAFEEIRARGMLRPERWLYASDELNGDSLANSRDFIVPAGVASAGLFNVPMPPLNVNEPGPGHAFVIDPLGAANTTEVHFPYPSHLLTVNNPWINPPAPQVPISGNVWPVRRITLPIPDPSTGGAQQMTENVAETIFRLRDDLAVELPERDDFPAILRWDTYDINNTPTNPTDDVLLTRQYQGNFSWLATIVPPTEQAHEGLQPALRQSYPYEVSVVVFYKRVPTPSAETERLLNAELLPGGELVMYGNTIEEVDKALEEINSGDWVAVMGVNQQTRAFMLKWYRLLALDEETHFEDLPSGPTNTPVRFAMLLGPDWHFPVGGPAFVEDLRVAILPGIASVVTREMVLERASRWNAN